MSADIFKSHQRRPSWQAGMKGDTPLLRKSIAGAVRADTNRPIALKLIYLGPLPTINGHEVNRFARSRLTKRARRAFGEMPPFLYPTSKAYVRIVRVLGPGQRNMDDDSIAAQVVGIRDALKPSYIKDDSQTWATFVYVNDGTRREIGPRIEVDITYEVPR
jgi:hypothetical protein